MKSWSKELINFLREISVRGQPGSRAVLVIIMLVLMFLAGGRYLMQAYQDRATSLQDRIQSREMHYFNLTRLVAGGEHNRREFEMLQVFFNEELDPRFIQAPTAALAEARLQDLVSDMAGASGLEIMSIRMLPRTDDGVVSEMALGISARGEIDSIKDFLWRISSHEQFVFARRVEISIINPRERRHFNLDCQLAAWSRP